MHEDIHIDLFRYDYETWFDACYRFSEQWSLEHAFEILYKQAVNDGFSEIDAAFESMAALGIYT
tara:strand:- start:666 stop:857 length:192 start_codon:yes stop_codon:yes gene_type:complete